MPPAGERYTGPGGLIAEPSSLKNHDRRPADQSPSTDPQDALAMDGATDSRVGEAINAWLSELEAHH